MAVIQVILLNGVTADANDVMADFTEIYTNITNANVAAGAGIIFSKLDAATVAGVAAIQTLTNKTLTSPIINNPTISGLTLSGAITLSTAHFTGDMNIWSGFDFNVYSDSGSTQKFKVTGASGDVSIIFGAKYNLSFAGIDYWTNSGTGINQLFSNSLLTFYTDSGGNSYFGSNVVMATGQKLFLSASINGDYIVNSAHGQNDLFSAGVLTMRTNSTGEVNFTNTIATTSGSGIFLDTSAGNDYIINTANGQNDIMAAGTLALRTGTGGTVSIPNGTLTVGAAILPVTNAAQNVGSGAAAFANYYVTHQIIYGTNTAKNIDFTTSTEITFNGGDISIPSGKKLIMNGVGGNTSITFNGGVSWDVIIGGNLSGGFVGVPTGATIANFFFLSQPSGGGANTVYNMLVGPMNSGPGGSGRALYIPN